MDIWSGEGAAGKGPVMRGDPRGDRRIGGIKGYCVGCAVWIGIFKDHLGQIKMRAEGGRDGAADVATIILEGALVRHLLFSTGSEKENGI